LGPNAGPAFQVATAPAVLKARPMTPTARACFIGRLGASRFRITERFRIEFRSEMYNATNSVHFGQPNVQTNAAQAGRITTTQIPNRQVQFGLWLVF
jgi:hypothetical protein